MVWTLQDVRHRFLELVNRIYDPCLEENWAQISNVLILKVCLKIFFPSARLHDDVAAGIKKILKLRVMVFLVELTCRMCCIIL